MTELGRHARGEDENRGVDHFLVDGVAPPVIGGDAAAEYEHQDPPTTPIPTGTTGTREDEPKPSWFARVFKRT